MFKKALEFIKSKFFITLLILCCNLIFSILFWFWGSLIAFNDVYIFSNPYLRFIIIFTLWLIIIFFFLLKPITYFMFSLKNEKRIQLKSLKKEANESIFKAKRNFFLSLQDAKETWKNDIKIKNLPLIIIIGNEGAGKSTFINYSNIEYPLSDSLESYKKLHKSTRNFALYISKNGALLDTEGNYFSQEEFFKPSNSDELPEDDLDKNKDFLIKKNVWKNFLAFLNKNFFHSKLNGIVLVIDTILFLNSPKEYSQNLIRYLTKRVNECENSLNLKLPIYIVFSKLDLIEGMKEYFDIFNEKIANKVLGLSFNQTLNEEYLEQELKELSNSLLQSFMNKNNFIFNLEDKNKTYLFLKQLDNLFSLIKTFILDIQRENKLKNNSYLRGIYFVSAYQENIPRNFLLDSICDKYHCKKILAKTNLTHNKQSYFVKSLLEDIIFKDYSLTTMRTYIRNLSLLGLILLITIGTYTISFYFVAKNNSEFEKSNKTLNLLQSLFKNQNYNQLNIEEKAELLARLKNILNIYPELWENEGIFQYFNLNISYKGFKEARKFYYELNEDVLKNTLLKEMENILQTDYNKINLIKTLYIYKSLFEQKYLNKNLLKLWINDNWSNLEKYKISKENFLLGIDELKQINLENFKEDEKSVSLAIKKLEIISKVQRIYILLEFLNSDKPKEKYIIKEELGFNANNIFSNNSEINSIDKIYTKVGMIDFLNTLNQQIENTINIESWMLDYTSKENKNSITMGILKLYLNAYQNAWEKLLSSLNPVQYKTKEAMLNELNILSKKDNPLYSLIRIISLNTNLNDAALLTQAYNLGLNAAEIKSNFTNITNKFMPYHKLANKNSILSVGNIELGKNSNEEQILDNLSINTNNLVNKIIDFSSNNNQSIGEKISYSLGENKDTNDAFITFQTYIKKLPNDLERYYNELSNYSWNFIENHGISLFNNAWINEVYIPFINDIAPFYPFNKESTTDLSMDNFKTFFGKNGILNNFYKKYLNNVLVKRKNAYFINPKFSSKLNFSRDFIDFITNAANLSNLMLNANDNIRVIFTLQSLDLSGDFSFINLGYQNKNIKYDHTFNPTLQIIAEEFNNGTNLNFTAYSYSNANLNYEKAYKGEWAWYKFIKESKNDTGGYSVFFNNNKNLYFDFKIINGLNDLNQILEILNDFKIVENITKVRDK
ncbi:type VI secretion system membrane subunit TssM [Campylobacter aviculae]|uniref:Type VI secretion system membrane subunit TssM n=1 Tax=Campylobacter aviculae TaxID=2510190 RepID=A0A4U7BW44_9BACT|nr:type VI secretion system membrane subunit TssM [Campylobacter aviculae]TKX32757.1 type VI secretion system membrane subunit TssM [Campylobacter aviculae]